jgi:hypothetical protein
MVQITGFSPCLTLPVKGNAMALPISRMDQGGRLSQQNSQASQ